MRTRAAAGFSTSVLMRTRPLVAERRQSMQRARLNLTAAPPSFFPAGTAQWRLFFAAPLTGRGIRQPRSGIPGFQEPVRTIQCRDALIDERLVRRGVGFGPIEPLVGIGGEVAAETACRDTSGR